MHLHYKAGKYSWSAILDVIYVITQVENIIINPTLPLHPQAFFQKYT